MQTHDGLQERQDTFSGGDAPVLPTSGCAQTDNSPESKPVLQPRGEKTGHHPGRMSAHPVFVLDVNGTPLTPTTPAKERKLLKGGVAEREWNKFGEFGIRMLEETRSETPCAAIGVDHGSKFEGYSLVVGTENSLNVKLDLPDKMDIARKMEYRKALRRARRRRNCRHRSCRWKNRPARGGFIAPIQRVMVQSRMRIILELCRIYLISICGLEDVGFDHARWGNHFSTVEAGKSLIRRFFADMNVTLDEYRGSETTEYRESYGYQKTGDKSEDRFESHCSDSLTLECTVAHGYRVKPGRFLVVDNLYRCVR